MLNRYDSENTHHWIDGYFILEKTKNNFNKAKAECIKNFKEYIKNVEDYTFKQFNSKNKSLRKYK